MVPSHPASAARGPAHVNRSRKVTAAPTFDISKGDCITYRRVYVRPVYSARKLSEQTAETVGARSLCQEAASGTPSCTIARWLTACLT